MMSQKEIITLTQGTASGRCHLHGWLAATQVLRRERASLEPHESKKPTGDSIWALTVHSISCVPVSPGNHQPCRCQKPQLANWWGWEEIDHWLRKERRTPFPIFMLPTWPMKDTSIKSSLSFKNCRELETLISVLRQFVLLKSDLKSHTAAQVFIQQRKTSPFEQISKNSDR